MIGLKGQERARTAMKSSFRARTQQQVVAFILDFSLEKPGKGGRIQVLLLTLFSRFLLYPGYGVGIDFLVQGTNSCLEKLQAMSCFIGGAADRAI